MLLRKPFEGHEDDMSKLPRRARNAVLAKRRANEERQQVKWKCSGGVGAGDYCSSSVLFDLGLSLPVPGLEVASDFEPSLLHNNSTCRVQR